ncbi:MAG TPA: acylphosphatase [Methanoregulaceae archaeon]|nr:acylphosphatase [Methanoregulaceae archaeon]
MVVCGRLCGGVTGFVGNLSDGSVLIVAEREDDSLETFVNLIRADCDPVIRVATLDITKSLSTGEFRGFGIR